LLSDSSLVVEVSMLLVLCYSTIGLFGAAELEIWSGMHVAGTTGLSRPVGQYLLAITAFCPALLAVSALFGTSSHTSALEAFAQAITDTDKLWAALWMAAFTGSLIFLVGFFRQRFASGRVKHSHPVLDKIASETVGLYICSIEVSAAIIIAWFHLMRP
jgi:cobalamin synthase